MVALAERQAFAERYLTDRDGRAFELTPERRWVLDEFWAAADGFKWWPLDRNSLCDACTELAGTITAWTWDNPTRNGWHQATGCAGLSLEPVICTILNLPRREGKTFNTAGFNLATIFKDTNKSILYVAAADKQTAKLFRDNYELPVNRHSALHQNSTIVGNVLTVPKKRSLLECVPTSYASITGTGRTHVVIDEARDVDGRVLMAALPSVFAENGLECPRGHVHAPNNPSAPRDCGVCGARLVPWFGRIIIMSSSGLLEGSDKEWFNDLIEELERTPDKNFHLFRKLESSNPNIHQGTKEAIARVFGKVPALRELVEVEVYNRATRKGDNFLTKQQIDMIIDPHLRNQEGSARRCVAYLDTSTTGPDVTSLVICEEVADDDADYKPFQRMRTARIDVWDPVQVSDHSIDEKLILPHLDLYMPMFPGLVALEVDARLQPWAERLIKICNRAGPERPWGKKVVAFRGREGERIAAWDCFEQRVVSRTLIVQNHPRLLKELTGVRKVKRPDGRVEVRDANRKTRHADVADGLAACCYRAHLESIKSRGVSLSQVEDGGRGSGRSLLSRIYRPQVRGLTEDRF